MCIRDRSITRDAVTGRQSDFSYPIPRDGAEEPGNGLSAKAYRWNAARCMPCLLYTSFSFQPSVLNILIFIMKAKDAHSLDTFAASEYVQDTWLETEHFRKESSPEVSEGQGLCHSEMCIRDRVRIVDFLAQLGHHAQYVKSDQYWYLSPLGMSSRRRSRSMTG